MAMKQDTRLAYIREPLDYDKGYDVVDARSEEPLAWRGDWKSANEIATLLNESYPAGVVAPAWDTLVYEIVGWRISGVAG